MTNLSAVLNGSPDLVVEAPMVIGHQAAGWIVGGGERVGMGADEVPISVPLIQSREITLTGTFRYANTYPLALHLIASGAVKLDPVITHHFHLAETEDALTLARRDPLALKAVVLVEPTLTVG